MSNAIYPLWKQEILKGTTNNLLNSVEGATGVFAALVPATYVYNAAHQFYSSLSGIIGTDQEILTKTQVGGVFDGSDVVFPSVTGVAATAIVLYRKNAGANTTWPLIAYIDTSVTNLPVTPNGGNIGINWNASGIFQL